MTKGESGGLPPDAPEMAVGAEAPGIERDEIAKRVYEMVYTTDAALLNTLISGFHFRRGSANKREALEFIRDRVVEMAVATPGKDGWSVFLTDKGRRRAVYRNLLMDYFRKGSMRVSYIDDHATFDYVMKDEIDPEERITSKLDLLRIVNTVKTKHRRSDSNIMDRFLIIFYAAIAGKEAQEIIDENGWDISPTRVSQIFRAGATHDQGGISSFSFHNHGNEFIFGR